MNILIPHTWLLEHLETEVSPKDLQSMVSLCGPSVERIYDREGEQVYDIEVTTNRVDSMSVRGVAREAAVILQQFGKKASFKPLTLAEIQPDTDQLLPLPKITDQTQDTHRVLTVILGNVHHTPTPDWMGKRLLQIDEKIHDSVIDITNFITHELGHPCHAFDYDKIMDLGGEIIITEAQAGEKFTTLDGEKYETKGGEIVYKNPAGEIIDLPAIKGTANTAVDDNTQNVLFWIESLDAKKIRFASMSHAIRTVAAQLNEKNVDPHLADDVLKRGVELYQELCGAKVASQVLDIFPGEKKPDSFEVSTATIDSYLGLSLPTDQIIKILNNLGCDVTAESKGSHSLLKITPPTFRGDLAIPADIVEEIARIYGYHNLPSTLMDTAIPLEKPAERFDIEHQIKSFLADIGWQELYTYSMVSEELAQASGQSLESHLKLQNPLTDDRVYLRRSLLPSLTEVLNLNSKTADLSVFEMAAIYDPQENNLPSQLVKLSLVTTQSYRELKGAIEALIDKLYISNFGFEALEETPAQFAQATELSIGDQKLGLVGILKTGQAAAELDLATLVALSKTHPLYQPLPKTTPVIEDFTFTLPEKTPVGEVTKVLENLDSLILKVELKDIYQQNASFTFYFLDEQKNLASQDLEPLRKKIVATMTETFEAQLVGAIG